MHKEDGEEFSLFQIQSEIVAAVQKKSCLELTIVTGDNAEHPLIPQLIRFAIRLGIPTTVCVDGKLHSLACLSLWTQAGLNCLELSMGRKHGEVQIDTVPKIATHMETLREEFNVDWGIAIYFDDWPLEEIVPIWEVAREQNASYFSLRLLDEEGGR
ncbi:MAG: hypothetical protein VX278_19100, partial [Myxococcota bacterium]|nr:hypothetical protein [Myxococcota bacterium]